MRSGPASTPHAWGSVTRRLAAYVVASTLFITACGGATAEVQPAATATVAQATVAPATPSQAPTASATLAATVNVEANTSGANLVLKADQIAVPAGNVKFVFKNADTKMVHELWVYPIQDITKLMAAKRANKDVDETEFLKDVAGNVEDVDPGATKEFAVSLKPGFYELACWKKIASADGKSAVVHFDMGQALSLAVTGAGGPATSISTPSSTISVAMKDGAYGSWILQPDHLVASSGKVTVNVTNNMKVNHDFVVYPIGDVSKQITEGLKAGEDIDLADPAQAVAENLEPGKTGSATLTLTPGTYVMACFMVSKNADGSTFVHRDMGQRITFWVK